MDALKKHEIFEIETLEKLKNGSFLDPLVFGGGTMLRLCYELNRYSSDLDFWFVKKVSAKNYFDKLRNYLMNLYDVTDACIKFYTLLFEIRAKERPMRLKIEIRKGLKGCDYQERIAFSRYGTKQVLLKTLTLEQMMKNKLGAALDRRDIRDCFDIEFLLRQGVPLKAAAKELTELKELIGGFKPNDFRVALGAVLEQDVRQYYIKNNFTYLSQKIKDNRGRF